MTIKSEAYSGGVDEIGELINKNPYACYFYHSYNTYDSEVLEQVESIMAIHNSIAQGTFIVVSKATFSEYEQSVLKLLHFSQIISSHSFMIGLRGSVLYDHLSGIDFRHK